MKKAILAVSYGTVNAQARARSVEAFEQALREAFPEYEVRRAFTGRRMREMAKKQGIPADSVEEALAGLVRDGFEEVAIQPSHVIGGNEFDSIGEAAEAFRGSLKRLVIGKPLLWDRTDLAAVCRLLHDALDADDAELVIMGHGSEHSANSLYTDFADVCRALGYSRMHIATLESTPTLDDLLPELRASGRTKITLTPLLFAAGDHACRDMAGDGPDSWKSRLEAEGFSVKPVVTGLGEYPGIRALYTAHMKAAVGG